MKYETYSEYNRRAIEQTQPAFLSAWAGLGSYHDDLVLLGGLVPQFICRHPSGANVLPHPATLDVDLGVALGASAGQYGTLATDLSGQGFKPSVQYPGRFEKNIQGFPVYIDFLVEDGDRPRGVRMVDDIRASVLPGVVRAIETARNIPIEGTDLVGTKQRVTARVCDVGPFLVLKLRALLHRQQGKDVFDFLYTLLHYDGGTKVAVEAFAEEARANNPAFPDARRALETLFAEEESPAPVKASYFVYGEERSGEDADVMDRRLQIQQDTQSAGLMLLKAIGQ